MSLSFEQAAGAIAAAFIVCFACLGIGGLLWAPFAALGCAVVAKRRGLRLSLYAKAGALHSIMFLFPWAYLLLHMLDIRLPKPVLALAYLVLYTAAISVGSLYVGFTLELLQPLIDPEERLLSQSPLSDHIVGIAVMIAIIAGLLWWHGLALWRLFGYVSGRSSCLSNPAVGLYGPRNVLRMPFSVVWVSLFVGLPFVWVFLAGLFLTDT